MITVCLYYQKFHLQTFYAYYFSEFVCLRQDLDVEDEPNKNKNNFNVAYQTCLKLIYGI